MVTLLERFNAKISSFEDAWDITQLSLTNLVSGLQAIKKTKVAREVNGLTEIALIVS